MPYGELITEDHLVEYHPDPNPRTEQVLFTGKPRDKESGLDYFGARFKDDFRFTSPDSVMIDKKRLLNPQSLNMYSYTANNPIILVDPNGEDYYIIIGGTSVNDPTHDKGWGMNYMESGWKKAANIRRQNKGAKIHFILHTTGYTARDKAEGKPEGSHLDYMKGKANEMGQKLSTISKSSELSDIMKNVPDGNIEGVDYFGHSNRKTMFLEYSSVSPGVSTDSWGIEDAMEISSEKFSDGAYFASWGCNQGELAGLMELLNALWNINTSGALGKTDYSTVSETGIDNWKPTGEYEEFDKNE